MSLRCHTHSLKSPKRPTSERRSRLGLDLAVVGAYAPVNMEYVIFRCDSSLSIGSGHVMRCRTLARYLQSQEKEIIFLCRRQAGDLIEVLQKEFRVLVLPEIPLAKCEGLEDRLLYEAWLGCSQEKDAADCLLKLKEADLTGTGWLVSDHYGLDIIWEKQMLTSFSRA